MPDSMAPTIRLAQPVAPPDLVDSRTDSVRRTCEPTSAVKDRYVGVLRGLGGDVTESHFGFMDRTFALRSFGTVRASGLQDWRLS
jgi:hypothetical protein